jgi:hypothetical protein
MNTLAMTAPMTVTAVLALGVALGACGRDEAQMAQAKSSAPGAATEAQRQSVDVCSLLTSEEIAAVTGAKVAEIKADSHGAVGTCNYQTSNEMIPVVSLVLAPNMPKVASSKEMAEWRSKQGGSFGDIKLIIEPIEGLGVPAIRNQVEGVDLVTVELAVKGKLLDVTTSSLEKSKALAPKAMARLH